MTRSAPRPAPRIVMLVTITLMALVAAGCSGLPTSSAPQVVRTVADQSVATLPQGPDSGQQPEQIVREFIHASALTEYDTAGQSFIVAQQFLTTAAQKSWHADSSSTPVVVLADDFSAVPDPDDPAAVLVTGQQVGVVESDRSYRPVDSRNYQVTMHLTRSGDQWRISDPPESVLLTENAFSTAFRPRTIYFLDSSGRVVVPDIRYIPNANTPDLSANRLMDLLLRGPSKQLAGAARTQLGPNAQLQSNVHIDSSGVAHVALDDVDASTAAARQALAAQIVWTLDPDVQQVAITVNGLPLEAGEAADAGDSGATTTTSASSTPQPTSKPTIYSLANGTVANFSPDVVPGSAQAVSDAYYIAGGTILRLSDSTPMWGSVGTGSVHVISAALSAASGALAAVVRDGDGGQQLLVGRPFDHQPAVTALKATTLTLPSFTRWGYAAWTVQNGDTQPEVYQVSTTTGAPTWSRVAADHLEKLGPVTALQLSPDGVRVAVVAGGRLYLGTVSVTPDKSSESTVNNDDDASSADRQRLQIAGLTLLRADLTDVGPVAWDTATNLLVGAKTASSTHRTVFDVSVDGQSVDPLTTSQVVGDVFGDVEAIASSTSKLPMLISFGSRIWQLQDGRSTGQWVPPNGRNWMPGTMPFYPR